MYPDYKFGGFLLLFFLLTVAQIYLNPSFCFIENIIFVTLYLESSGQRVTKSHVSLWFKTPLTYFSSRNFVSYWFRWNPLHYNLKFPFTMLFSWIYFGTLPFYVSCFSDWEYFRSVTMRILISSFNTFNCFIFLAHFMLFLLHDHVLTTVTMNTLETMHPQSQGSKKKKKKCWFLPSKRNLL